MAGEAKISDWPSALSPRSCSFSRASRTASSALRVTARSSSSSNGFLK